MLPEQLKYMSDLNACLGNYLNSGRANDKLKLKRLINRAIKYDMAVREYYYLGSFNPKHFNKELEAVIERLEELNKEVHDLVMQQKYDQAEQIAGKRKKLYTQVTTSTGYKFRDGYYILEVDGYLLCQLNFRDELKINQRTPKKRLT